MSDFEWRKHVVFDDNFPEILRPPLIRDLDLIAHAHQGEGAQLISNAAAASKDGKIQIWMAYGNDTTAFHGVGFAYNPSQVNKITVSEHGVERPLSSTGIVVHELYHLADPNVKPIDVSRIVNESLHADNGSPEKQALTVQTISKELNSLPRDSITRILTHPEDAHAFIAGLPEQAIPAGITRLELSNALDPARARQVLSAACVLDSQGLTKQEEDAVHYTDAFMQKNFGTAEPQRSSYANAKKNGVSNTDPAVLRNDGTMANPYALLDLSGIALPTQGFKADSCIIGEIGALARPPEVAPVPTGDKQRQR